jgi:hypothetical protein
MLCSKSRFANRGALGVEGAALVAEAFGRVSGRFAWNSVVRSTREESESESSSSELLTIRPVDGLLDTGARVAGVDETTVALEEGLSGRGGGEDGERDTGTGGGTTLKNESRLAWDFFAPAIVPAEGYPVKPAIHLTDVALGTLAGAVMMQEFVSFLRVSV